MRPVETACLLAALLAPAGARGADPVTVYRCTDASGRVSLGDVPCAQGASQEVRTMQRPVDGTPPPAARPAPSPSPSAAPASAPAPQVVVVHIPRPMYECVTPDGKRYTSDSAEGNPRWVPLWTLGYRSGWRGNPAPSGGGPIGEYYADRPQWGRVGAPTPRPSGATATQDPRPGHPHRPVHPAGGAPGTWIRDTCHALPQAEICARLADRREEIRRRFFNAQQSERDALRVEERGLNARLAADCGRR